MSAESNPINVVVLGAGFQGKSALIIRFVSGIFVNDYDPTIEDNYRKLVVVDDDPVMLDILDTAGQEEYASMTEQWILEGQIFILVYSVDSVRTTESPDILTPYQQCSALRERIMKLKEDDRIPLILVATKCDVSNEQRTFSKEDGEQLSKELNCPYLEVSAKDNYNLDVLWDIVVKEYSKYAKETQYTFTLDIDSQRGPLHTQTESCCHCTCFGPSLSTQKSLDIISSNNSPFAQMKGNVNHSKHTRVNTESEMTQFGDIGIEEKDVLAALKDVEDETDEAMLEQITEDVMNNDDIKEEESDKEQSDDDDVYIPRVPSVQRMNSTQIKMFSVHKLPVDGIFEPILSCKHWNIGRRFYWKRFIISILCGVFLPIVIILQTLAFLLYIEGNKGGFYYPKKYKYANIHHGILFDFMGIVIGRKPNQDPEIEKDRKWFLRQTICQKISRVILSIWICILYCICIYNVYNDVYKEEYKLRVSLMETVGPMLLLSVLWILLSLWIAYESKLKPQLPPLTRLRSINLYFGHQFDRTTSAYKFLRGYLASIHNENTSKLPCFNLFIMMILSLFYASIPGLTRLVIGDPSDGLKRKKFITYKEWKVESGALIVNAFLMIAMMYTMSVQYKKYLLNYREWMFQLTMFLESTQNDENNQLDDDFDDDVYDSDSESMESKYFANKVYLSLKRKSNVLGFLETRSFLESQGKLFFGEQELPLIWMMIITISLTIFILYRVFFIQGNPIQSVLFNGVSVLAIICLVSLIQIMVIVDEFDALQIKQESFIEMQKFMIRCSDSNKYNDNDELEELKEREDEIEPLITSSSYNDFNMLFIEDMLTLVKRKDIHPKLYKIKLNAVLIPLIAIIITSGIIILIKLFVAVLLF